MSFDKSPIESLESRLAQEADITNTQAEAFLRALATVTYEELRGGPNAQFQIPYLGTFYKVCRSERSARHPLTGEMITVPAKWILKFRAATETSIAVGAMSDDSSSDEEES